MLCYITYVMLCCRLYVMFCYRTEKNVMLYNMMCHSMCHVCYVA